MVRYLSVLVAAAVLAMTATSGAAARTNSDDVVQIYQLQAVFQRAASTMNLNLLMSLWADDATLSVGDNQGYEGKDQIRGWFAKHYGPFRFKNHWVSLTASPRVRIEVQRNQASLYFESHYFDVATRKIMASATVNTTLARIKGKWLIKDAILGSASL